MGLLVQVLREAPPSLVLPLFDKLLDEVISADPDAIPELGPENRAEQAKAKVLKAQKSDFFAK